MRARPFRRALYIEEVFVKMKDQKKYCPIVKRTCLQEGCSLYYQKKYCCGLIAVCDLFDEFKKTLLFQEKTSSPVNKEDSSQPLDLALKRLKFLTSQVIMCG
jgi:transposase